MFKKQNIIFLGGRRAEDPTATRNNPFRMSRNLSSNQMKNTLVESKNNFFGNKQSRLEPQKTGVLKERLTNLPDGGGLLQSTIDKPNNDFFKTSEKNKQKDGRQTECIIQRIEQQKKEFMERVKARQSQRDRFLQPIDKDKQHGQDWSSPQPELEQQNRRSAEMPRIPDRRQQTKTKRNHCLVGLTNIGNTCFMNATLQCLFNIPDFNQYFLSGDYRKELKSTGKVADQYAKLFHCINSSNSRSENPSSLKLAISSRQHQFAGFNQQDAQQFLVMLLEAMGEDLSRVDRKLAPYRELTADTKRHTFLQISDQWWKYNKLRDDSIIIDFFSGQMLSQVVCSKCSNQSIAFDNFRDVSLSFPRGDSSPNLTTMIQNFLKEETLADDYFCTNCKKLRQSKRKLSFFRMPRVLVIQLKRFTYGKWKKQKINHPVSFADQLDLSKYLHRNAPKANLQYELIGMVNHSGGIDFGHYTADCKNPLNNKWYHFNDSSVGESSLSGCPRIESTYPYLLFYYRMD